MNFIPAAFAHAGSIPHAHPHPEAHWAIYLVPIVILIIILAKKSQR